MLRRINASSKACLVRFASWWIKWARGCGEHGRCIRLWPSALESHACNPCTWPKLQPPTNPKAAHAAARRRFGWPPCCRVARAMWLPGRVARAWPALLGCSKPQQCNRCVSSVSSSQMQRCDSVQPVERQQCSNATSRSGRSKLWMSSFAGLGPAFRPTERVIYRARGVAVSRTESLRTLRLALVAYRPLDNNPVRLVAP